MKYFKKYIIITILLILYILVYSIAYANSTISNLSDKLILYILVYSIAYANSTISNLSDKLFRLHVIANSNSETDQNLKYKVRDSLISYMNDICKNASTKQEAICIANTHIKEFTKIAQNTIKKNGFNYKVKVTIGNYPFPTKTYGDISLPAGYYDALKVEIGEAKGKNWWCVMFPSLCFVDMSNGIVPEESKKDLQNSLSIENYNLISSDNSEYQFKFKIVELLENAKILTAKK